jgi:hypothetical protein
MFFDVKFSGAYEITDVLKNADKYRAELKEDFLIEKCVEKYLALTSG